MHKFSLTGLLLISLGSITFTAPVSANTPTTLPSERPSGLAKWDKQTIYEKGDTARYLGRLWRAKWWTQGERPQFDHEHGPWKLIKLTTNNSKPELLPHFKAPRYRAGIKYQAGDKVTAKNGRIYRCKDWPQTPWCELKAYAPGDSQHWRQAWDRI
ncbi:carbohydrate-binding protein [Shewanella marina]|uniref:carbohydrate-binding protein n=1 Tax=Shewanella marina TaxID=487319 RepID=UPI0004716E7D|nr:carbohydrate-binding protein [Shewanella marina]